MSTDLSEFPVKTDFFRDVASRVTSEASHGAQPRPDVVDRIARGMAIDVVFAINQSAQQTGLHGYLAFLRSPQGQQLSQYNDFGVFYDQLHASLVEELVAARTKRKHAEPQATELIDNLAGNTLSNRWADNVEEARRLLRAGT